MKAMLGTELSSVVSYTPNIDSDLSRMDGLMDTWLTDLKRNILVCNRPIEKEITQICSVCFMYLCIKLFIFRLNLVNQKLNNWSMLIDRCINKTNGQCFPFLLHHIFI